MKSFDVVIAVVIALSSGCGGDEPPQTPFGVDVVSFTPGDGAGFGSDKLPDIVLGPPKGGGESQGGQDVVSLGKGGVIVLQLGLPARDGDGPDLIVFENAFKTPNGTVFSEPGEVSVSDDGETFTKFPCADDGTGCAGFEPVLATDQDSALNASTAGGDQFDLAVIGVSTATFVRIEDKGPGGPAPTAGFDLDAIAAVNVFERL